MNHEESQQLLDAYLDDQLEIAEALHVESHVNGCGRCQAWLAERRVLVARLRSEPLRYALSAEVASRIQQPFVRRKVNAGLALWPRALAAGMVLGVVGLFVGRWLPQRPDLREALVAAHVRAGLGQHALDVASSDHHTVKPWLSGKLSFSPPVPELNEQGDALVGARIDYLERTRVAALVYQHNRHTVDVFVWPDDTLPLPKSSAVSVAGFHLVPIRVEGFDAVMVSDMGAVELRAFAKRWSDVSSNGDH